MQTTLELEHVSPSRSVFRIFEEKLPPRRTRFWDELFLREAKVHSSGHRAFIKPHVGLSLQRAGALATALAEENIKGGRWRRGTRPNTEFTRAMSEQEPRVGNEKSGIYLSF